MKILNILSVAVLSLSLSACQQSSNTTAISTDNINVGPPQVVNETNTSAVYNGYLELKNALVKADVKTANKAAANLAGHLKMINGCDEAAVLTRQIADTDDIKVQRSNFLLLSNDIITLIKGAKLKNVHAFVNYCPMANNSKGGYWLSATKNIENPYLDDSMKGCGELKDEIK